MGGTTKPSPSIAGTGTLRNLRTTPTPAPTRPDLFRPDRPSVTTPTRPQLNLNMGQVNPPLAPNGRLNLNPMPQPPMSIRSPGVPSNMDQSIRYNQDVPQQASNLNFMSSQNQADQAFMQANPQLFQQFQQQYKNPVGSDVANASSAMVRDFLQYARNQGIMPNTLQGYQNWQNASSQAMQLPGAPVARPSVMPTMGQLSMFNTPMM